MVRSESNIAPRFLTAGEGTGQVPSVGGCMLMGLNDGHLVGLNVMISV